jgi:2,4-dienoyl-CoA reductase-like NADH-dependent reductase (Old Yellow Enzyme family)
MLEAAGLDLIHVSHGGGGAPAEVAAADSPFEPLLHLARLAKGQLPIPVIGVGGIKTPDQAEGALARGFADLIAVGKAILADPGWTRKVLGGREDEISLCIDCKPRCFHFTEPDRCPARKKLE